MLWPERKDAELLAVARRVALTCEAACRRSASGAAELCLELLVAEPTAG